MAKYSVVRTDNMFGTDVRSGLVSVKYMGADGNTATAIENGHVVLLDGLMKGEREIFKGKDVDAKSPREDVVLIASPEVEYDERKRNLEDYINEAGKVLRGYRFHSGDDFSVTKDAIDGTPEVGHVIELKKGNKLADVATLTPSSTEIGKVIAIEKAGRHEFVVIKVK